MSVKCSVRPLSAQEMSATFRLLQSALSVSLGGNGESQVCILFPLFWKLNASREAARKQCCKSVAELEKFERLSVLCLVTLKI